MMVEHLHLTHIEAHYNRRGISRHKEHEELLSVPSWRIAVALLEQKDLDMQVSILMIGQETTYYLLIIHT